MPPQVTQAHLLFVISWLINIFKLKQKSSILYV